MASGVRVVQRIRNQQEDRAMDLTNATLMKRVTLIFLRLMLVTSCLLAIASQFEWARLALFTPHGFLLTAVDHEGPALALVILQDPTASYRHELEFAKYDDPRSQRLKSVSQNYVELPPIFSVPGFRIWLLDLMSPSPFVILHFSHLWIIPIAFALNIAVHWSLLRRVFGTKRLKPQSDS